MLFVLFSYMFMFAYIANVHKISLLLCQSAMTEFKKTDGMDNELLKMMEEQLCKWSEAMDNYAALDRLESKCFTIAVPKDVSDAAMEKSGRSVIGKQQVSADSADSGGVLCDCNGLGVKTVFNPARAVSTLANVNAAAIAERPCFLCAENRPSEQESLDFTAVSGNRYSVLLNPYPIFRRHFTVPAVGHCPQRIEGRFGDMLELAERFEDMVVLYNGAECGASAPDHFHFQMGEKGFLPFERDFDGLRKEIVLQISEAKVCLMRDYIQGIPVVVSPDAVSACLAFEKILRTIPVGKVYGDRMVNVLCWKSAGVFRIAVFPRKAHRPSCYFLEESERLRISPGTVDLCGVFVVPARDDFQRVSADALQRILSEVVYTEWQPAIEVGLLSASQVSVVFRNEYKICGDGRMAAAIISGEESFRYADGKVEWCGELFDVVEFAPLSVRDGRFTVRDVVIGIDFHWERKEDQIFSGGVKIFPVDGKLTVVNIVEVEDYLFSVISSEMNENAPEEFLKAHAVISRSWLLARPTLSGLKDGAKGCMPDSYENGELRHIRWYDRDDHTLFDVCADDHCQRYQGLGRISDGKIRRVMDATRGQVLKYGDSICDARFSKCCGGVTEVFPTCWGDEELPYLKTFRDSDELEDTFGNAGLADNTTDPADVLGKGCNDESSDFCNTADRILLAAVLNDYDRATMDFYRWEVSYTQDELSELIQRKSGLDFGSIVALKPLRRGPSGRIYELRIVGTKMSAVVGKELEIRKFLSESHLYSSAFEVEAHYADGAVVTSASDEAVLSVAGSHTDAGADDLQQSDAGLGTSSRIPVSFTLKGRGWGHGVGLCQIGAAVMGSRGYSYERILLHYYRGARIEKLY